ncbi:hypothetical protein HK405_005735, partial [Cladochytrium tenue]
MYRRDEFIADPSRNSRISDQFIMDITQMSTSPSSPATFGGSSGRHRDGVRMSDPFQLFPGASSSLAAAAGAARSSLSSSSVLMADAMDLALPSGGGRSSILSAASRGSGSMLVAGSLDMAVDDDYDRLVQQQQQQQRQQLGSGVAAGDPLFPYPPWKDVLGGGSISGASGGGSGGGRLSDRLVGTWPRQSSGASAAFAMDTDLNMFGASPQDVMPDRGDGTLGPLFALSPHQQQQEQQQQPQPGFFFNPTDAVRPASLPRSSTGGGSGNLLGELFADVGRTPSSALFTAGQIARAGTPVGAEASPALHAASTIFGGPGSMLSPQQQQRQQQQGPQGMHGGTQAGSLGARDVSTNSAQLDPNQREFQEVAAALVAQLTADQRISLAAVAVSGINTPNLFTPQLQHHHQQHQSPPQKQALPSPIHSGVPPSPPEVQSLGIHSPVMLGSSSKGGPGPLLFDNIVIPSADLGISIDSLGGGMSGGGGGTPHRTPILPDSAVLLSAVGGGGASPASTLLRGGGTKSGLGSPSASQSATVGPASAATPPLLTPTPPPSVPSLERFPALAAKAAAAIESSRGTSAGAPMNASFHEYQPTLQLPSLSRRGSRANMPMEENAGAKPTPSATASPFLAAGDDKSAIDALYDHVRWVGQSRASIKSRRSSKAFTEEDDFADDDDDDDGMSESGADAVMFATLPSGAAMDPAVASAMASMAVGGSSKRSSLSPSVNQYRIPLAGGGAPGDSEPLLKRGDDEEYLARPASQDVSQRCYVFVNETQMLHGDAGQAPAQTQALTPGMVDDGENADGGNTVRASMSVDLRRPSSSGAGASAAGGPPCGGSHAVGAPCLVCAYSKLKQKMPKLKPIAVGGTGSSSSSPAAVASSVRGAPPATLTPSSAQDFRAPPLLLVQPPLQSGATAVYGGGGAVSPLSMLSDFGPGGGSSSGGGGGYTGADSDDDSSGSDGFGGGDDGAAMAAAAARARLRLSKSLGELRNGGGVGVGGVPFLDVAGDAGGVSPLVDTSAAAAAAAAAEREKPFLCSVCQRRFLRKHDLRRHALIHSEGGPPTARCEVCLKTFT